MKAFSMKQWLKSMTAKFTNCGNGWPEIRRQRQTRLRLETLEERELLSGSPLIWTAPSSGSNSISLAVNAGQIQVRDHGLLEVSRAVTSTSSITLNGGAHVVNTFDIQSTPQGIATTIQLAGGSDSVVVGNNSSVQSILGNLTVHGVNGSDKLTLDDSADKGMRSVSLSNDSVTGLSSAGSIYYSGFASLTLDGAMGDSVYSVNSTASGTAYTLNGGGGKNTLVGPNNVSEPETLTGFAAAGIGPGGETNDLYIGFTSSTIPGVSISKITFDTTAEHVFVNPYGTGVGGVNNGVGSYTFFPSEPPFFPPETVSVYGFDTSGFGPGASLFDANFNLQTANGDEALPSNLQGAKVTVDFSDGLTATTTLTTIASGTVPPNNWSYYDVEGVFTATGSGGLPIPVTWKLTGANAGSVGNVSFNHIENLTGGTGSDIFQFGATGSVSGTIKGSGGTDTLDYDGRSTPVTVNLQSHSATGTGGFSNMNALVGGSGSTTLVGTNAANTWNITGANSGNLNGTFTFTGVGNLTGGTAMDVFKFSNGASVRGTINGGGGGDWLDYSAYTTAITVDLASDTASHTGGIRNIQNVRAGSSGSTLTGDAQGNILVGGAGVDNIQSGSGRSVLIGGGGADRVKGGTSDDIIIGGTTSYDTNDLALMSILDEWQSSNSYTLRISHLKNGGGLNDSSKLIFGTTVHDDGEANILTGGAGMNWFFKGAHDKITDLKPGEQVN